MVKLELTQGKFAILDDADFDRVAHLRWAFSSGYAVSKIKGKRILMHRIILDAPAGKVVDHINGDGLDNRRSNLRVCTHAENFWNSRPQAGTRSGIKGVQPRGRRWQAFINANGVRHHLGYFDTKEQAREARAKAERRLHGEFAHSPEAKKICPDRSTELRLVVVERRRAHRDLSPQEARVADLLAEGNKLSEIAQILTLAPNTISTHLARMKKKLGARNSVHAAVIWARRRWAADDEYRSWGKAA